MKSYTFDVFKIKAGGKEVKIDSLNQDELDTFMDANVKKLAQIAVKRSDGKKIYYASTGKKWQKGAKIQEETKTYGELLESVEMERLDEVKEMHYSDQILFQLKKLGWAKRTKNSVSKGFPKLGKSSNIIKVSDKRNVIATFSGDLDRRRYIEVKLGDKLLFDMDMRDYMSNPKAGAKALEKKLNKEIKKYQTN